MNNTLLNAINEYMSVGFIYVLQYNQKCALVLTLFKHLNHVLSRSLLRHVHVHHIVFLYRIHRVVIHQKTPIPNPRQPYPQYSTFHSQYFRQQHWFRAQPQTIFGKHYIRTFHRTCTMLLPQDRRRHLSSERTFCFN